MGLVEYILSAIALHRDAGLVFGDYETFLGVCLTLNLIFFAFRGPVVRFVNIQAKVTSKVVKGACGLATTLSKRPEELEGRVEESRKRLRRVASIIISICRLCLPIVAITTLWLLAAYDSDEPIGQYEYWLVLSMSVPIVFGVVALYSSFFFVAAWHSFAAMVIRAYFAKPKSPSLISSAQNVVHNFEASRTSAKPDYGVKE